MINIHSVNAEIIQALSEMDGDGVIVLSIFDDGAIKGALSSDAKFKIEIEAHRIAFQHLTQIIIRVSGTRE